MTRMTPYSATFAGRKIASGKLSLDLEYKIKQRQLQGENQVIIDRLELGERVESATAKDLPLDLAIAILSDSDGRIELGLPISGSLDDPQFSYGQIIWKAITNVLGKIVTAPFRALGALFGGGGEKIDKIAFEAGAARLTPPEREKLVRLATVLNKRPGLALSVHGTWAEVDRVALQDLQLRRSIAERSGQVAGEKGDPGPLTTRAPKVQAALESLFADSFGSAELATLKEGFRNANPGQLEENLTGKMMSRLSGLLREKRSLSEAELGQLKGADFHALLFERMRVKEVVKDDAMQALAVKRAEHALENLKASGAPEARIRQGTAEKSEAVGRDILLKLELGKASG
jgi:outer membrane protein OmpA-like peptidoglycan-associated protein